MKKGCDEDNIYDVYLSCGSRSFRLGKVWYVKGFKNPHGKATCVEGGSGLMRVS